MDAGNFFAPKSQGIDVRSAVSWLEMERLGYDAVTLGRAKLARMGYAEGTDHGQRD